MNTQTIRDRLNSSTNLMDEQEVLVATQQLRLHCAAERARRGGNPPEPALSGDLLKDLEAMLAYAESFKATGTPAATAPPESGAIDPAKVRGAISSGKISAAAISAAGEISRCEQQLAAYAPGTKTHRALSAKLATLRAKAPKLSLK